MARNTITLNGISSETISGLIIQELPPISKPAQRTETELIDGRDGDITTPLGFAAYDKEFSIGLYGDFDINAVIAFFNSEGTVVFSNEPDKYYNYQIVAEIDFERLVRFRTAKVKMHCQPFKYSATEGDYILDPPADNLLEIPNFTQTTNGVTLTANNGTVNITGSPTAATEFYLPITSLALAAGSYTLSANASGKNPNYCSIRLIGSAPSDADSFGGRYITLAEGTVTLDATLAASKTFGYLWFYMNPGQTFDFNATFEVEDQAQKVASDEGTFLTLENSAEAPFNELTLKGDTEQDGDPTPDAPVDIKVVKGRQTVTITGKNLLDQSRFERGSIAPQTGLPFSDNTRIRSPFIPIAAGTYTISNSDGFDIVVDVYDGNRDFLPPESQTYWQAAPSYTFTITNGKYVRILFRKSDNSAITPAELTSGQLEKGSTATDYQPHGEQNFRLSLGYPLPTDYQPVEYLESSGLGANQIIDLDYLTTPYTRFAIDYERKSSMGASPVFGARQSTSSTAKMVLWANNNGLEALNYGSVDSGYLADASPNDVRHVSSNNGATLYYNDVEVYRDNSYTKTADTLSLYMFGLHSPSGADIRTNAIKLYGLELWEGDELTANFVPCYRKSDSLVGLYDTVRKRFYSPVDPTLITKGADISPIELCKIGDYQDYLWTDGEKWYKHKVVGKVTRDGSETYTLNTGQSNDTSLLFTAPNIPDATSLNRLDSSHMLSNRFGVYNCYGATMTDPGVCIHHQNEMYRIERSRLSTEDVAGFQAWLAENPVDVYYILGTDASAAIDEEITDATLISQLNALNGATAYRGRTHIISASESSNNLPLFVAATVVKDSSGEVINSGNTTSKPKLTVYGSGDVTVSLNNIQLFQIALGNTGYITIDTAAMEAYKDSTGNLQNRLVTGDYDNFALNPGSNTIAFTGEVTKCVVENYSRWL